VQTHTVEAFVQASSNATARATGLAQLGAEALREFEKALGRPLLARSHWPLHVRYTASGGAAGAGSAKVGAFLEIAAAYEGVQLDYLAVEQLARVVVADLLTGGATAPYWVQEAFIQWLTSAAMYALYPSLDVHEFHRDRIEDYRTLSVLADDYPLAQWDANLNIVRPSNTGSVRSLMFALELNNKVGSAVMSQVFQTFANGVPDGAGLLARLKGASPADAAVLDALYTTWVTGSGNNATDRSAIKARLADGDGDRLYLFEEEQLGTSDASSTPG
jgi:hypothetical protein